MDLTIIAAVSENNVIGDGNEIPWHISEDLSRFKRLTLNHPVIMGRKTYESIVDRLGHPLEDRVNIVLSKRSLVQNQEVISVHSLDEAMLEASYHRSVGYIIGGQSVYEETLKRSLIKKMEITEVHREVEGDTYFPELDWKMWDEINRENHEGYSFVTYERK